MSKSVKNIVRFLCCCIILGVSQSGIIDSLYKCSTKDSKCQKQLFQEILHKLGENGSPELSLPPYDPIHLKNISVSVLNLLNITLVEGIGRGVKDCVFEEFTTDFEKSTGKEVLLCDIAIKGNYKLTASSPLIASLFGGSDIHGAGKGKVKIEKLRIEFVYPLTTKRGDDGEIYLKWKIEEIQKKFDVLGKVSFAVDNVFLGKEDISKLVNNFLNENYKYIMKIFAQPFFEKAAEMVYEIGEKFFDHVPAKYYISDDLTPYLTE